MYLLHTISCMHITFFIYFVIYLFDVIFYYLLWHLHILIINKHLGQFFSCSHQVHPHSLCSQFWETSWTYSLPSRPESSPCLLYESCDACSINCLHLYIIILLQAVLVCCGKYDVLRLQGAGPPSPHAGCSLCWYQGKGSHTHLCRSLSTFSYVEKRMKSCEISTLLGNPICVLFPLIFPSVFM